MKSTVFSYRNIHKYSWSSDGKTQNKIEHVLRHSSKLMSDLLELNVIPLSGGCKSYRETISK
jgi:hypothetical protein